MNFGACPIPSGKPGGWSRTLHSSQAEASFAQLTPQQLQIVANRLVFLTRIDHIVESTEQRWRALVR